MRLLLLAVALGFIASACSDATSDPRARSSVPRRSVVAARVVADDTAFPASSARVPRFVPCQGLSGCARSATGIGELYPGAVIPPGADVDVDHTVEFLLYLVGARFERADLAGDTLHVEVTERAGGFQMVKLDGRQVLASMGVGVSFEQRGRVICSTGPSWEGCSG
jgi:hypothetical protein